MTLSAAEFDSVFDRNHFQFHEDKRDRKWSKIAEWLRPKTPLQKPSTDIRRTLSSLKLSESEFISRYEYIITSHFVSEVQPKVINELKSGSSEWSLEALAEHLKELLDCYLHPLQYVNLSGARGEIVRIFNALVKSSVAFNQLTDHIRRFIAACRSKGLQEKLTWVLRELQRVGLKDEIRKSLPEIISVDIQDYVNSRYAEVWDDSVLISLNAWVSGTLLLDIRSLFDIDQEDSEFSTFLTDRLRGTLFQLGTSALVNLRTKELFDIVVRYGSNTRPALEDLKACMKSSAQRANLVSVFQAACARRLLQGGADTADIVSVYISTIKAFNVLEPRGVLLEKVSGPIRRYLKERPDTINVIVSGLLGEGKADDGPLISLHQDLKHTSALKEENLNDLADPEWNPDPVDAPPDFMRGKNDTVDLLVTLFENKDVFVKEFDILFADRLLQETHEVDDIMYLVELLKLRFGERELQNLDVMIRDIVQSRRTDAAVHSSVAKRKLFKFIHAKILSRLYWPTVTERTLKLPHLIMEQLDVYGTAYSKKNNNDRKLKWIANAGSVSLDIEMEDRTLTFKVSPEHAAVIASFQDGKQTLEAVAENVGLSESHVKQLVQFWVSKGVIRQDPSDPTRYTPIELQDEAAKTAVLDEDILVGSGIQSAEERNKEEMKVYWTYIVGMLTNLGALPVDRIHSFLKMFAPSETPYGKSPEELEQFLNSMVDEEKLELNGTNYKLAN
ncbi:hypothetical protein TRVA0_001S06788 [Trichomonascus vanleenenianus]|uniref:anaphase promoting complex subunit 2 n=1 Tax=Trichomonascus vanleenenianus TaxID=2268995 RepID=UPI003ECA5B84